MLESWAPSHLERMSAVQEALRWADERLDDLWEEGDVEGLVELAEAARQVGERRFIDAL